MAKYTYLPTYLSFRVRKLCYNMLKKPADTCNQNFQTKKRPTIIHETFETNPSFHVKQRTIRKVHFLAQTKFSFLEKD